MLQSATPTHQYLFDIYQKITQLLSEDILSAMSGDITKISTLTIVNHRNHYCSILIAQGFFVSLEPMPEETKLLIQGMALMLTAAIGNFETFEILLSDLTIMKYWRQAFYYAAEYGQERIVKAFLFKSENGFSFKSAIDSQVKAYALEMGLQHPAIVDALASEISLEDQARILRLAFQTNNPYAVKTLQSMPGVALLALKQTASKLHEMYDQPTIDTTETQTAQFLLSTEEISNHNHAEIQQYKQLTLKAQLINELLISPPHISPAFICFRLLSQEVKEDLNTNNQNILSEQHDKRIGSLNYK